MLYQSIKEYVSRTVVKVTSDTSVVAAMQLMNDSKITSIVVCEDKKAVGILTTRDLLTLFSDERSTLERPVSEVMTHEIITCLDDITLLDAFDIMTSNNIRHIPIVDEHAHLTGIVSETDIMRSLGSIDLMRLQTIAEIMHSPVTTVGTKTPLSQIMKIFQRDKIGSVVVEKNDRCVGIITERDIPSLIRKEVSTSIEAEKIMSHPLITINGGATSQEALLKMSGYGIHHLVVTNESGVIEGIVSRSSFFHNLTRYLIRQLVKSESKLKQLLGKTEQEVVEHQLVEMGNFYFSAIKKAPHGVVVHQNGKIVYVNEMAISLFCRQETKTSLIGRPYLSFVHPDSYQDAFNRIEQLYDSGGETPFINEKLLRSDGSEFMAETSSVQIPYDSDSSILVTIKDITEKLLLEEQLLHSQKLESIGTLVGGIAHDFNNMLAGITGNVFLAKMALYEGGNPTEELEHIEKLGFHASEMIQQLLAFARKSSIEMKPVPLAPFIKETIKLHRTAIPENITLETNLTSEMMLINGDATQLQQALINLVNNARDAVFKVKNPTIVIKLEKYKASREFLETHDYQRLDQEFARLTVYDNGYGIPEQNRIHLFEPFFTTKEVGEGSGLGLAMVYGTTKTHKGVIEVESQENRCTAFHLYFPLIKKPGESSEPLPYTEIEKGSGETILLVDDQEEILEVGREVLARLGYKSLTASDGEEAIRMVKESPEHIHLAILDLVMPKVGGVEASKEILKISPGTKIMFSTGYDRDATLNGDDLGEVLKKPFTIPKLSRAIKEALQH